MHKNRKNNDNNANIRPRTDLTQDQKGELIFYSDKSLSVPKQNDLFSNVFFKSKIEFKSIIFIYFLKTKKLKCQINESRL
jgi:hypothetical protein